MAIASYKPTADKPVAPTTNPVIAPPDFKGVVEDTKYKPLSSLLTYIRGASWTVDYYSQIIDTNNDLRSQDPGITSVHQPYKLIKGMELKVSSPLSSSQNAETGETTITGTALIYPFLIPNVGDMFVGDTGDSAESVFTITSSERRSFRKQSVYQVEFEFRYNAATHHELFMDLQRKATEVYYFEKDFLLYGQNPMVVPEEYALIGDLKVLYKRIISDYFQWFHSKEYKTLLVPDKESVVYDPRLVDFMLSIVNTNEAPEIPNTKRINLEDSALLDYPSFWTGLLRKSSDIIIGTNHTARVIPIQHFARNPMMNVARYTGIQKIVYPTNSPGMSLVQSQASREDRQIDVSAGTTLEPVGSMFADPDPRGTWSREVDINGITYKLIPDTFSSEYYGLNPFLLNEDTVRDVSLLEDQFFNYMKGRQLSSVFLTHILEDYEKWDRMEQFYYLPICLVLLKSHLGSL